MLEALAFQTVLLSSGCALPDVLPESVLKWVGARLFWRSCTDLTLEALAFQTVLLCALPERFLKWIGGHQSPQRFSLMTAALYSRLLSLSSGSRSPAVSILQIGVLFIAPQDDPEAHTLHSVCFVLLRF